MTSLFKNLDFNSEKELFQYFQSIFEENNANIDIQDVTTIEYFLTSLVDTEVALSCYFDMLDEKSDKFMTKLVKDVIYDTEFDEKLIPLVNSYDYTQDIVNVRLLVRKCDKSKCDKSKCDKKKTSYNKQLFDLIKNGEDEKTIISCISVFKDTGYEVYIEITSLPVIVL